AVQHGLSADAGLRPLADDGSVARRGVLPHDERAGVRGGQGRRDPAAAPASAPAAERDATVRAADRPRAAAAAARAPRAPPPPPARAPPEPPPPPPARGPPPAAAREAARVAAAQG